MNPPPPTHTHTRTPPLVQGYLLFTSGPLLPSAKRNHFSSAACFRVTHLESFSSTGGLQGAYAKPSEGHLSEHEAVRSPFFSRVTAEQETESLMPHRALNFKIMAPCLSSTLSPRQQSHPTVTSSTVLSALTPETLIPNLTMKHFLQIWA